MTDDGYDTANEQPHGGGLTRAAQLYGIPIEDWLDLSTGINPVSYPMPDVNPAVWQRLSLESEVAALIKAARRAYNVPGPIDICAAPGTQAIIQWLPRLLGVERADVTVLSPTYGEHAHVWRQAGCTVREQTALPEAHKTSVTIVTNPNNPDGRVIEPETLLAFARQMPQRSTLIVDEAFCDVTPSTSVIPHLTDEPVLVLRSFGKFFGLAGLRLGFAVGQPNTIHGLVQALGPWAVPQPALTVGTVALADSSWIAQMQLSLNKAAERLDTLMGHAHLHIIGGTNLFRLIECDAAALVHEQLAKQGIWTRPFHYKASWLRFGLPGNEADWERLEGAVLNLRHVQCNASGLPNAAE